MRINIIIVVLLTLFVSACGFNKQTLKDAKCQFDKAGNKVVCEVPVPAEAVK